jgi:hypothetical protein
MVERMTTDQIWWKQVPKAIQFVEEIVSFASEQRSQVLFSPGYLPWWDSLYEIVSDYINFNDPEGRVVRVTEEDISPYFDIDNFILNEFCSAEKRVNYRRGQSIASFLAKCDDIILNQHYIWIHGVPVNRVYDCMQFIVEYQNAVPKGKNHGVFILEVDEKFSVPKFPKGLKQISFNHCIDTFDSFAFCTMVSLNAKLKNPIFRPYLVEIASAVCGSDIELCAACIAQADDFLQFPYQTLKSITEESCRVDGTPYLCIDERVVFDKIWEGQIRMIFPYLEKYRKKFVFNHYEEILRSLPLKKEIGEGDITDPRDIELGQLMYLISRDYYIQSTKVERESLPIFKEARNKLAHLTPLSFEEVEKILTCYF